MAALALGLGYLTWRGLATLNLAVWWITLPLLLLEVHATVTFALFTLTAWDVSALPPAPPVTQPPGRVAVLIPTYNEPVEVLLPTVAAAVCMRLEHETWVLDDGNRSWVRELAADLGARYLTRADRTHAKAGNVNHALGVVDAEFVAILDADHVASPDFLVGTLGYFTDPRLAVVQTPQEFYNLDSFEHVPPVRRGGRFYSEQSLFYRVQQAGRNRWNGAFWCGTNAVLRTQALADVGGVATDSVTEDIHTTIRLHRRGWRTAYHNEVLARGLAAADAAQYLSQRVRWGTGAMQVLRRENPLAGRGLALGQRLCYAATLCGWFDAWRTLGYLLVPITVLTTGATPIRCSAITFASTFVPTLLVQQLALRVLGRGHASLGRAMLFEFVRMPANIAATLTLLTSRPTPFHVTGKGRQGDTRQRIRVPRPHAALLALSAAALTWFALSCAGLTPLHYASAWVSNLAAGWLLVNLVLLATAVRRIRSAKYASERRAAVRFAVPAAVTVNDQRARVLDVSLTGVRLALPATSTSPIREFARIVIEIGTETATLDAMRSTIDQRGGEVQYSLEFLPGQRGQQAALACALFTPGHRVSPPPGRSPTASLPTLSSTRSASRRPTGRPSTVETSAAPWSSSASPDSAPSPSCR